MRKNKVWLQRDEFLRESLSRIRVTVCRPASVDPNVVALRPAELLESPRNAATKARPSRSLSANPISMPIRCIRSGCCPLAATGHVAAAPPRSVMNSRRFM
jgi:hypothetical protein